MAQRTSLPVCLPGATEFSAEPQLLDELWAIRTLRQQPQWCDALLEGTNRNRNWGRPRIEGSWALAYLGFVVSGRIDVEPWWANTSSELWRECGFAGRPSYQTVWSRFIELEHVAEAFTLVAGQLIQHARRHTNGLVGQDLHVDATEAETNARLVHDCQTGEGCGRQRRRAKHPRRAHADEARAERHQRAAKPPPEDPDALDLGDGDELRVYAQLKTARVRVGSCWYRTRDHTAGVRAYTRNGRVQRFWHGFYNCKAIDHYTGAPVAVEVCSASVQEYNAYPALLERVQTALDGSPRAVVADKGLSVSSVFELNTRAGIASVMPYRPHNRQSPRQDAERYDRHGIPRCKGCGGPTLYHRFAATPSPRLWFRCELAQTDACESVQSIACSHDWRTLLPMWRTEPAYFALKETHTAYERVHQLWRSRYRVGAEDHSLRPKRHGVACQQLRANAALLIEWLRIIWREGWLGSARRNPKRAFRQEPRALSRLLEFRRRQGLTGHYGPAAEELGLGVAAGPTPPGDPPGDPPGFGPPDDGAAMIDAGTPDERPF